jgi:cytoskeletal protein CcmA (bactofilin family)
MNIRNVLRIMVVGGAVLAASIPGAALAAEVRTGSEVAVAPGEVLNEDLFATGQTVTIAGNVSGDVFAMAQSVVVTGTIDGDLIAGGQQVVVDGTVNGDVRAAGAVVTVNGRVERSVTSAAQQVNISSSGQVGGSLVAAGETISTFGAVGRGITAGAGTLALSGPVGGDVLAWAERLSFGPNSRIAGDLDYHSEREATVPAGVVSGRVQFTQVDPEESQPRSSSVLNGLLDFGGLIWLVGAGLLGAAVIMLAPRASARAVEVARQRPLQTFGLGLLAFFAVPIMAVLIGVTLVGLPIAVALAGSYVAAVILAWPAVALVVGTEVARRARRGEQLPVLAALVVGLILLHLVTHIPFLGQLVGFCAVVFGLGMLMQSIRGWRRVPEPTRLQAPEAVAVA